MSRELKLPYARKAKMIGNAAKDRHTVPPVHRKAKHNMSYKAT